MNNYNINHLNNNIDNFHKYNSFHCAPREWLTYINPDSRNKLKIFHVNIRSVNKNFDELLVFLTRISTEVDIVILTECWLNKVVNVPVLHGYNSHRSTAQNQNDGVIVYVRFGLPCEVIANCFLCDASCLVLTYKNDTAIVAVYRSPSIKNAENFLLSLSNLLVPLSKYRNTAILGDININILNNNNDSNSETYLNVLASHGLLPGHLFVTHDNSCLDHVILRTDRNVVTLVSDSKFTDHAPILTCIDQSKPTDHPRIFSRVNFATVINELEHVDFSDILSTYRNANNAAELLVSKITACIKNNTETIKASCRKRIVKPWITPGLLRCIRNRDRLHKNLKNNPDSEIHRVTYLRYRNFCNRLLKKLKRLHEQAELQKAKCNPRATWDVIKSIANIKSKSIPSKDLLNLSTEPKSSVNLVNHFFVNIGNDLASKIQANRNITATNTFNSSPGRPNRTGNSMVLLETDEAEVTRIISGLRSDSAVGYDGIPSSLLKSVNKNLAPIITQIFNLCLTTGTFPGVFKKALVHPIHKGGDRRDPNNYRPISVLTSLSKVMEKILNRRLINYLDKFDIISENQYGFRRGLSTEDGVMELTKFITKNIDKKAKVIGTFLDLSKAFDTVSVPMLINKMEDIGIRGAILEVFRDYLTGRKQCTKIESYTSDDQILSYGVPQGSVLGPTLFLIYINSLCQKNLPNCKIIAYADDTVLLVHGDSWEHAQSLTEDALRSVAEWLNDNLLTLNVNKTKYITFSASLRSQPKDTFNIKFHTCSNSGYTCCCLPLTRADSIKYLGVHLDSTLSWSTHIDILTSRTRKIMPILRKLRNSADLTTLRMVYFALAQSILNYCIPAWGGACVSHLLKLERAQRAVLKVMTRKPFRYPTTQLYLDCEVLSVRQLYVLQVMLRKHATLPFDDTVTNRRRRYRVCQTVPHRTALAGRQYCVRSSSLYNKINKILDVYPLPKKKLKIILKSWLQCLNYLETENLLKSPL